MVVVPSPDTLIVPYELRVGPFVPLYVILTDGPIMSACAVVNRMGLDAKKAAASINRPHAFDIKPMDESPAIKH